MTFTSPLRRFSLVVAGCVLVAALFAMRTPFGTANFLSNPLDFNVFRCAARAVAMRADPYRVEPLRACEHESLARVGLTMTPGVVVPAPLPPYAVAAYLPFATLPYERATVAFAVLNVAAAILIVVRMRALCGLPLLAIVPAVLFGIWLPSVNEGQPVPIVVAALCSAAWELRRARAWTATAWLALAALEPHLVAATFVALLTARKARAPMLLLAAMLAVASFAIAGSAGIAEYVRSELPLHADAEIRWLAGQQSIPAVLFALGEKSVAATRIGNALWIAALVVAVALARRLARETDDPALLALVPAALALPWAPYLHGTQYGLVIPAALMLAGRFPRVELAVGVALAILCVPWDDVPVPMAPAAAHRAVYASRQRPQDIASAGLREYIATIDARERRSRATLLWLKVPVWLAFAALTSSAFRAAYGTAFARANPSDSVDLPRRSRSRWRSYRGGA